MPTKILKITLLLSFVFFASKNVSWYLNFTHMNNVLYRPSQFSLPAPL